MGGKKSRKAKVIAGVILFIIIGIPLIMAGLSFIGKIAPDSVIPDSFELYASAPDPVRLVDRLLNHDPLPDLMALAEAAPLIPVINQFKNSNITKNVFIRFAARGRLDAAFLNNGRILAAWDSGILSPLLRFLPALAGRLTIPGLYYVQAGKNSRFEYRQENGAVFFIGPYKNLLVISNSSSLYESVIAGASRQGDLIGSTAKRFHFKDYDLALLLSREALMNFLAGGEGSEEFASIINRLKFPGAVQMGISIQPNQLTLNLMTPLDSDSQPLQKIIGRNSRGASMEAMISSDAQYLTLLSAGSLKELFDAASVIGAGTSGGAEFQSAMRRADSAARMTVGMNLEELLFSWTGEQFAIFGLEGRPNPVIAVEIRDEIKRREVFDRAFRSIIINENIRLNLDGNRIPRIELPLFLDSFLRFLDINVPSPYYTVQNNCLFISESAEALLSAVNSVRRNEVLPKTDLWRSLSREAGPSTFSIFYSLDRSLPFFLKGSSAAADILKSYRQGLARLTLNDRVLTVSLSVIPGAGKGLIPAQGFPLDLASGAQGRAGRNLYQITSGKESRLVAARGGDVLSINPADRTKKELRISGANVHVIPAEEGAIWTVNSNGQVHLLSMDLEPRQGFPLSAGLQLSSPPAGWKGKLYLSGEDGSIHTVDSRGSANRWGMRFSSPLRSPLSFIEFRNKTYAAAYPKSIVFGEIFILDDQGNALPSWPFSVPGIAFGSPLLFSAQYPARQERLFAAFITQAGELSVYTDTAEVLQSFPIELDGVFYLQPVFDGDSLWIIESEGTLYRISLGGEVFSQKIPGLHVREEGYITVADIDKDRKGEIFFSGQGNALHGYSGNFNSLDGFPLPVWGRPVFADINNDGKIDVAGLGMDNRLYMWQFR